MASDFNRDTTLGMPPPEDVTDAALPAAEATLEAPLEATPLEATLSPAAQRFKTCRWQQPSEGGSAEFCTHREVKPYAGTSSFDPTAWCGDCQHYKLRRVPKKRTPGEDWSY